MHVFGNRQLEQVITGKKKLEKEKTSRRLKKLKKKILLVSRIF